MTHVCHHTHTHILTFVWVWICELSANEHLNYYYYYSCWFFYCAAAVAAAAASAAPILLLLMLKNSYKWWWYGSCWHSKGSRCLLICIIFVFFSSSRHSVTHLSTYNPYRIVHTVAMSQSRGIYIYILTKKKLRMCENVCDLRIITHLKW